jgi:hypothetical protein
VFSFSSRREAEEVPLGATLSFGIALAVSRVFLATKENKRKGASRERCRKVHFLESGGSRCHFRCQGQAQNFSEGQAVKEGEPSFEAHQVRNQVRFLTPVVA